MDYNVSVVLADDQAIVREGLAALCTSIGMRVIGQCADGEAAVEMIRALTPDFAVLELHMPKCSGLELVRSVRAEGLSTRLVILSMSRDESAIMEILRAGADAYLLKDKPFRHLLDALGYILDGGVYLSPLLHGAGLFTRLDIAPAAAPLSTLSPREMEVFYYLVDGLRAKDIAGLLDISPKTVDTYRAGLMRKLRIHDLVGLVKFAIERNLTTLIGRPAIPAGGVGSLALNYNGCRQNGGGAQPDQAADGPRRAAGAGT